MNKSKNNTHTTAAECFQYRYPPFADTFEISEPFQSQTDSRIIHRAVTFIRQGKSIAIYGEAGTGKSMLIKSIANELDIKNYRIVTIPYGGLKPNALMRELCEAFDIDLTGRKSYLTKLQKHFRPETDKPFPVIIVDDAHVMEKQSFIDLCSLLHDAKSRTASATLILAGHPVLKKMLELDIFAAVRTRLTCRFQLPKLDIEEAKEFIQFRLQAAEASQNLFHDQALDTIAADSNGNRRILMNLAALCLEETARRKEKVVTADIVNAIAKDQDLN